MNVRNRSALLVRNTPLICLLLSDPSRAVRLISPAGANLRGLTALRNWAFCNIATALIIKPKYLKYTPIGINFPFSAHYETMSQVDNHLDMTARPVSLLPLTPYYITYPYFTGLIIAITPISKKPFSYALYKLLRMSMQLWFQWPRRYAITTHFTYIQSELNLLRFLNIYYFRIYSL